MENLSHEVVVSPAGRFGSGTLRVTKDKEEI